MITEENKDPLIRQYAEGLLAGEQLTAFEQKMAADPDFAAEVRLYIVLQATYRVQKKQHFKQLRQQKYVERQPNGKTISMFSNMQQWYRIAAVVLLFLFVGLALYWYVPTTLPSATALSEDYIQKVAEKETRFGTVMGEVEQAIATPFVAAYQEKNCELCQHIADTTTLQNADFYKETGMCYLGRSQVDAQQAISTFMNSLDLKRKKDEDVSEVSWYLILAYVQARNWQLAKQHLEMYQQGNWRYKQEEAKKLLEAIKNK